MQGYGRCFEWSTRPDLFTAKRPSLRVRAGQHHMRLGSVLGEKPSNQTEVLGSEKRLDVICTGNDREFRIGHHTAEPINIRLERVSVTDDQQCRHEVSG